jgi:hypothetical protein
MLGLFKKRSSVPMKNGIDEYDIRSFFEYHAQNMPPASYRDFWSGSPLCPSHDLDALEAAKRLHRDMQAWAEDKGYAPEEVQLLLGEAIKQSGYVTPHCRPLAQIVWKSGPEHWPVELMQGRSYGKPGLYMHAGKKFYIEPATAFILSFEELRTE